MKQRAFTLIELSIVLVIIGLIVGGVLVGRDLIQIAQARALMSQMEKFQAATNTFRLKYNCKAGDCANATQFGFSQNGNGDGYVGATGNANPSSDWPYCAFDGAGGPGTCITAQKGSSTARYSARRNYGEAQHYWADLSAAGLIENTIVGRTLDAGNMDQNVNLYFPKDALGKFYLDAFMWNSKLYIRTGLTGSEATTGYSMYADTVLNSAQANYIQSKLGLTLLATVTNGYPDALERGDRANPLGVRSETAGTSAQIGLPPTFANPPTSHIACVISDGSGGYKYNIDNGGNCNMMWQIDY